MNPQFTANSKYQMCKKAVLLLTAITGIVFVLFLTINWVTWGAPWDLIKPKEAAQKFLQAKYSQEMIAESGYLFIGNQEYVINAYPVSNPNLRFQVYVDRDDFSKMRDNYYSSFYKYELASQIREFVNSKFGNDSLVYATIDIANGIDRNMEVLSFSEFLSKYEQQYSIHVYCKEEVTDIVKCADNVMEILQFTKDAGLNPSLISFSFDRLPDRKVRIELDSSSIEFPLKKQWNTYEELFD